MAKITLEQWETDEDILEELKENKKRELSTACQDHILAGFNHTISGVEYHFTYTADKQSNFTDTMRLFDNNMVETIGWNAYKKNEKVRLVLDKEEFTELYLQGVKHKMDALTRYNDRLVPFVDAAEDKETVNQIYWDTNIEIEHLNLVNDNTMDKQLEKIAKKHASLDRTDTTTMMALVQLSSSLQKNVNN